jgi:hypothetical protein
MPVTGWDEEGTQSKMRRICKSTVLSSIALSALFLAAPAPGQVVDTPEEAKQRLQDLMKLPQGEQIIVAAATASVVRDARDLCGFKLTAFAEHVIAGAEKFSTVEQRSLAETLSYKIRPRAPLAEFCDTVREEFGHAPAKWFTE